MFNIILIAIATILYIIIGIKLSKDTIKDFNSINGQQLNNKQKILIALIGLFWPLLVLCSVILLFKVDK
jgi:hypothetical protein